jgi:hypothetical protein
MHIVSQVNRNFCGERIWRPNAFEVETRMFSELVCSEAVSFLEPQLPPNIASLRRAILA